MDTYKSSDQDLATYLLYLTGLGILKLISQKRDMTGRVTLEFSPGDIAQEEVNAFISNKASVPPRSLLDSVRTFRTILRQTP
ncbi:MAG: hypothetical protein Q8L37_07160 [Candidatus Gottesmanbacteria bacterium]|nr:hypothetical protein [Candidatus Gottesmanbacteria bacterium]